MSIATTSTFKLTSEHKRKWVEELRSDRYVQGTCSLYSCDGSYCCLGVLCLVWGAYASDLYGQTYPHTVWTHKSYSHGYLLSEDDVLEILPNEAELLMREYDNEELSYAVKHPELGWVPLSHLNDERRFSFKQIADVIEQCVEVTGD